MGVLITRFGAIFLLWVFVNRILVDEMTMMDEYLNFAQIAGALGDVNLNWPRQSGPMALSRLFVGSLRRLSQQTVLALDCAA